MMPKMKRVKLPEKTTRKQKAVIVVVDPYILTSMNLIFPSMDIFEDFLADAVAASSRQSRRPTVEKRNRSNDNDNDVISTQSASPIVMATQLIFPPLSELSSSPSSFAESSLTKKKRKVSNDDKDRKPAAAAAAAVVAAKPVVVSDDAEEDRKPSAIVLLNKKRKNEAATVICLDCDDDDDYDDVSPSFPTIKTAPAASMTAVTISSDDGSDDDDDNDDDEVQIPGSNGDNALADYPHARTDCVVYKFDSSTRRSDSNKLHCKNCYCFVCDMPSSQCKEWSDNHCNASSGCINSKWVKLRRQKRDVVKRASTTRSSKKKKKKTTTTTTTTKRATTTTTVPRRKKQTIKMKTMAKTPKA
jgi:hypothetical protein